MIENKTYPSQPFNWFLFLISIPIAFVGLHAIIHKPFDERAIETAMHVVWLFGPIWFYSEIQKYKQGFTKVMVTTNKLFKCRIRGTDEVFFLKADTEQEAELFFETMKDALDGKQVFIEESNDKIVGFDMEIPKEKHEN